MATGPRNHDWVKDVSAVNVLVNFYNLIDENQSGLTSGLNYVPNHYGLMILGVIDDRRRVGRFGARALVVLMNVDLFEVNSFLAVNRISSKFMQTCQANEGVVDIFPEVDAGCQPSEVEPFEACAA